MQTILPTGTGEPDVHPASPLRSVGKMELSQEFSIETEDLILVPNTDQPHTQIPPARISYSGFETPSVFQVPIENVDAKSVEKPQAATPEVPEEIGQIGPLVGRQNTAKVPVGDVSVERLPTKSADSVKVEVQESKPNALGLSVPTRDPIGVPTRDPIGVSTEMAMGKSEPDTRTSESTKLTSPKVTEGTEETLPAASQNHDSGDSKQEKPTQTAAPDRATARSVPDQPKPPTHLQDSWQPAAREVEKKSTAEAKSGGPVAANMSDHTAPDATSTLPKAQMENPEALFRGRAEFAEPQKSRYETTLPAAKNTERGQDTSKTPTVAGDVKVSFAQQELASDFSSITIDPKVAATGGLEFSTSPDVAIGELYAAQDTSTRPHSIAIRAPELQRHIASQIIEIAHTYPDNAVEITLNPEELGRLRMTFQPDATTMNVVLQFDRAETMDLMRRHIEMLAQDMRELGYEDVSFSFEHNGEGTQEDGSDQRGSGRDMQYTSEQTDRSNPAPLLTSATLQAGVDIRI